MRAQDVIFCTATAMDRADEAYRCMRSVRRIYPEVELHFDALLCEEDRNDLATVTTAIPAAALPAEVSKQAIDALHVTRRGRSIPWVASLSAAWRLFMLPRLASWNRPLLWLDTDCLVRLPLEQLFHDIGDADLAIVRRSHGGKLCQVLSSVFVVNATPGGRRFLQQLLPSYLQVRASAGWFADQMAIYHAAMATNVNLYSLPESYNSCTFLPSDQIWHAKNKRRSTSKTWLAESAKFA